jgi:hypothetical protein
MKTAIAKPPALSRQSLETGAKGLVIVATAPILITG